MSEQQEPIGKFLVRRAGVVEGPWPASKLKSEVKIKKLARYHEIQPEGGQWESAAKFEWLFPRGIAKPVPAHRGSTASNPTDATFSSAQETSRIAKTSVFANSQPETTNWYIAEGDNPVGPFSASEIIARIRRKELLADDQVWTEAFSSWQEIGDVNVFADCFDEHDDTAMTRMVDSRVGNGSEDLPLSGLAILSLIASFIFCIPIFPIAGIIMGVVSMGQIKKGECSGKNFAMAGIAFSVLSLMLFALLTILVALGIIPLEIDSKSD